MKSNQTFESVWDALEDDPVKAENMKLRSILLMAIHEKIKGDGLTQTKAAKVLSVSQPRVSALMQGKIELFRLDTLINFIVLLGLHVDLKVAA